MEASMEDAMVGRSEAKQRRCQKDAVEGSESSRVGAGQALEGAAVALGDEKTWKALSDESKKLR